MAAKRPKGKPTAASPAFVRAVALGLPGVKATNRLGAAAFSVEGTRFLTVAADGTAGTDAAGLLPLHVGGRDAVRQQIEDAWRAHAAKRAVTAFDRARAKWLDEPAVTAADIRALALSLPGVVEGPIWGRMLGFLVGDDRSTKLARFGPPEGDPVTGLGGPDDVDTLLIMNLPQRPVLVSSAADRFFTTPHYGDPSMPGTVIIRFAEHRGKAALTELGDLLEDAWREVVPTE